MQNSNEFHDATKNCSFRVQPNERELASDYWCSGALLRSVKNMNDLSQPTRRQVKSLVYAHLLAEWTCQTNENSHQIAGAA